MGKEDRNHASWANQANYRPVLGAGGGRKLRIPAQDARSDSAKGQWKELIEYYLFLRLIKQNVNSHVAERVGLEPTRPDKGSEFSKLLQ